MYIKLDKVNNIVYTINTVTTDKIVNASASVTYTITATFAGNSSHKANSTTYVVTATKKTSNISSVAVNEVYYGNTSSINVTMNSTESGSVIIQIDNTNYTVGITSKEAKFTINTLSIGTHNVTVYYLGDDYYKVANPYKTSIKVKDKEISKISIDSFELKVGENKTITVKINDKVNNNVNITINGKVTNTGTLNGNTLTVNCSSEDYWNDYTCINNNSLMTLQSTSINHDFSGSYYSNYIYSDRLIYNTGTLTSINNTYSYNGHTWDYYRYVYGIDNRGKLHSTSDSINLINRRTLYGIYSNSSQEVIIEGLSGTINNSVDSYGLYVDAGEVNVSYASYDVKSNTNARGTYITNGTVNILSGTNNVNATNGYGVDISSGTVNIINPTINISGTNTYGVNITGGTANMLKRQEQMRMAYI